MESQILQALRTIRHARTEHAPHYRGTTESEDVGEPEDMCAPAGERHAVFGAGPPVGRALARLSVQRAEAELDAANLR